MKSSVVIFIYKREKNIHKIIEVLRRVKPKKLYIVADGPKLGENKAVDAARKAIQAVDWPCTIKKIYSRKNLGLRVRIPTGINTVFQYEDRAIFIEDDCIPDPTFFHFCDELLEKYKSNKRIMSISGNNFQFNNNRTKESYYYSKYPHIWGWATWRRAWKLYDVDLSNWEMDKYKKWILNNKISKFWISIFDAMTMKKINTWDYQLTYTSLAHDLMNIIPNVNLVSNIGYGTEATHTIIKDKTMCIPIHTMEFPLLHPKKIVFNTECDNYTERTIYYPIKRAMQDKLYTITSKFKVIINTIRGIKKYVNNVLL